MAAPMSVSVSWLKENLGKPGIKVVDGTWHLPIWNRDSSAEYISQHIVGAVKFNVDAIADSTAPLPRVPPPLNEFEEHIGKLGIANSDHVIVYDNNSNLGMFSAPRVWYMFKLFGHDNVSILDGGLPKWLAEGGQVVSGPQPNIEPVQYKGSYHKELHKTFEETLDDYNGKSSKILDARPPGRFEGRDPEPNPKIPSGHIIGTTNLFWLKFVNPETKLLKTTDEMAKVFADAGVNLDESNIASCGGGISACWIAFAARFSSNKTIPVFTGSWLEWYKRGPEESKVIGVKGEDMK